MEHFVTITTCDRCNVEGSLLLSGRHGAAVCVDTNTALSELGWAKADYGVICPACFQQDAEDAARHRRGDALHNPSARVQPWQAARTARATGAPKVR